MIPVAQTVEHGTSNATVTDLIPRKVWIDKIYILYAK